MCVLESGAKGNKRMNSEPRITEGSGNVYADLGLPDPEVALAKAELALRIKAVIEQRRLTQVEAAKLLGVDQAKVSALIRGRLSGFSTDRLFRFLNALGRVIEIVVRPGYSRARLRAIDKAPRVRTLVPKQANADGQRAAPSVLGEQGTP